MRVFADRPIAFALLKVEAESHLIWGRAYRGAGARPRTARGLNILPCRQQAIDIRAGAQRGDRLCGKLNRLVRQRGFEVRARPQNAA